MVRTILGVATALCLGLNAASAEPKTMSLWHPFTLETDMIHGGIKSFNESQDDYRVEAADRALDRRSSTELVKAIATGSVPDLVTIDNPVVRELLGAGNADGPDRPRRQVRRDQARHLLQGALGVGPVEGPDLRRAARRQHAGALLQRRHVPRERARSGQAAADLERARGRGGEAARSRRRTSTASASAPCRARKARSSGCRSCYQAGGSIEQLDQPEAVEALQLWVDFVKNGLASRDVINQRQYEVANTFMAGNAAMVLGGPWELPRMEKRRASSTGGWRCCRSRTARTSGRPRSAATTS